MHPDQQRRRRSWRGLRIRVGRQVHPGMRLCVTSGRERDLPRHRHPRCRQRHPGTRAQHLGVDQGANLRGPIREGHDPHQAITVESELADVQALEPLGVRRSPLRDGGEDGVQAIRVGRDHGAVRQDDVARLAEDPGRDAHLGLDGIDRGELVQAVDPMHVPPVGAIRADVQGRVPSPLGLHQRLTARSRLPPGAAQDQHPTGLLQQAHPQLRGVPRHVRVVPRQPGQLAAVPGDPRGGHEV